MNAGAFSLIFFPPFSTSVHIHVSWSAKCSYSVTVEFSKWVFIFFGRKCCILAVLFVSILVDRFLSFRFSTNLKFFEQVF